jgi:hypothetical protein
MSTPTQTPEQHLFLINSSSARLALATRRPAKPFPESSPSGLGRILVMNKIRRLRKRTFGNVDPAWIGPETLYRIYLVTCTLLLSHSSYSMGLV